MEVFTMVVLVVFIGCATGVISDYLKTQRTRLQAGGGGAVKSEIEDLRRRVAVLEEIVTDERYRLDHEIGQLSRQS